MARARAALLALAAAASLASPALALPLPPARTPALAPAPTPDPFSTARVSVRAWTDRDGLPQNTVRGLLFDAKGRLWVGTQDGLAIRDGRAWIPVALPEGARFVHRLMPARDGGVWVGTLQGGAVRVSAEGAVEEHLDRRDGLPDDEVYGVVEAGADLWLATGHGVARRRGDHVDVFGKDRGLLSSSVLTLAVTRDAAGAQTVWVGTYKGLARFDGERFVPTEMPGTPGPVSAMLVAPLAAGGEGFWAGTTHGACLFDGTRCVEHLGGGQGLGDDQVNALAWATMPDGSRALWLGTERAGLYRVAAGAPPLHVDEHHGLPPGAVEVLASSPSGGATPTVWAGMNAGGLAQLDLGTWRAVDAGSGLPRPGVNSLLEARGSAGEPVYYAGTQGGLSRLGPDGWTDAGVTRAPVLALLQSEIDGALWVGFDGGMARVAGGEITRWTDADGLPGTGLDALVESRSAAGEPVMWAGIQEGLAVLERGKVVRAWTEKDGLPDDYVVAMAQSATSEGRRSLWIGTPAGLARMDESTRALEAVPLGESEDERFVMSLEVRRDGGGSTLWVGTRAGPLHARLEGSTPGPWARLPPDVKAKLPNLVINAMRWDADGRLYLFTNRGVARLEDPEGAAVTVFTVEDGLPSGEFNTGASMVDHLGRLWAGTPGGVALYDPRDEVIDRTPKPLWLEQGAALAGRRLDWDRASVTFGYGLASYVKPEASRFRTQLAGWEAAPSAWTADARREYSNLPSGRYTFEVWGRDAAGNVSGPVAASFEVLVAPWRAWWAYLTYAAVAAVLGATVVQLRERALHAKNAALEATVAARTREIAERNAELAGTNLALADNLEQLREAERRAEAKARDLDRNLGELRRLNAELVASQVQADRIFSALAEALPGTVLDGKYRLEARIGAGGFGAVFSATHLALRRAIAVKVFKPSPGNDSAQAVERFKREGQTASLLTHPNAVRVLDAGVSEDGIAYLVMELLEGRTLADELAAVGPMALDRVWRVLEPMCAVLSEAHQLGIVHRDVKPSNIFLHHQDGQEVVKVVDFGIAKLLGEGSTEDAAPKLTMTGGFVGTPVYMAPERLMNKTYGAESDVYSVGVVCFQMLTGQTPFHQSAQNLLSLVWAHVNERPPSLRELRPDVSAEVDAVVQRALASDPAARPTMEELAALFAGAAGFSHAPGKARATGGSMPAGRAISGTHVTRPAQAPTRPRDETGSAPARPQGATARTAEAPPAPWPGEPTRRGT